MSRSPSSRQAPSSACWVRLAVALYFTASVAIGLVRLSNAGWAVSEARPVLTLWYVEALAFLAVWGAAAGLKGLFSRPAPRRSRLTRAGDDPLRAAPLAGVERQRGR